MEPQDWIPARPRRVLLAGYLDWCLLAASFGLLEHIAYVFEPEIGEFPLYYANSGLYRNHDRPVSIVDDSYGEIETHTPNRTTRHRRVISFGRVDARIDPMRQIVLVPSPD